MRPGRVRAVLEADDVWPLRLDVAAVVVPSDVVLWKPDLGWRK